MTYKDWALGLCPHLDCHGHGKVLMWVEFLILTEPRPDSAYRQRFPCGHLADAPHEFYVR